MNISVVHDEVLMCVLMDQSNEEMKNNRIRSTTKFNLFKIFRDLCDLKFLRVGSSKPLRQKDPIWFVFFILGRRCLLQHNASQRYEKCRDWMNKFDNGYLDV